MSQTTKAAEREDEDDTAPGDIETAAYQATEGRRGGARCEFLWFVTYDRTRDEILPLADIRRIEPPRDPQNEVAYIHFSGVSVRLCGVNLRRVLHRIAMQRCAALYELRPGQHRPDSSEPVIDRMEFKDTSRPKAKAKDETAH
jgi:hypothetical protein